MDSLRSTALVAGLFLASLVPGFAEDRPLQRIAFGSCVHQDKPQPVWDAIVESQPQAFFFLGDNIYGDSEDLAVLKAKWDKLAAQPGLQKLREKCAVHGTWDDHDFGKNDAGADYPMRKESQGLFLDFLGVAKDSPRRAREGVYHSEILAAGNRKVQVILLDVRYFRSPLKKGYEKGEPGEGRRGIYVANNDAGTTVLGDAQWKWLEERLKEPADVRLIGSGTQMIADEHGWECWGNFPAERARLFRLIRDTRAGGVVLLSGDRHFAEIARLPVTPEGPAYPLYEVTSSSLNVPSGNTTKAKHRFANELNSFRVGLTFFEANFGQVLVDWSQPDPVLRLQVCDEAGGVVLQQRVALSTLQPKAAGASGE